MTTAKTRRPSEPEPEPEAGASPAKTEEMQDRDPRGRFKQGASGNPGGKRPGMQHRITKRLQALILPAAPEVISKLIVNAKSGDLEAMKLYLRLIPKLPRLAPTISDFPVISNAGEASAEIAKTLARLIQGEIDLETYGAAIDGLRTFIAAHERVEIEAEIEKYRAAMKGRKK
jgi:hypothetical protein